MPSTNKPGRNNTSKLRQYASLGTQLLIAIGLAVFLGIKSDEWLCWHYPVLTIVLLLLVISGALVKVVKDTSSNKKDST
jgi:undecaprenyl pyrophosphate phosphatase UppP